MTDMLDQEIEDPRIGQQAWLAVRPRLATVAPGDRLPRLDVGWAARQVFPLARQALQLREPVLARLSESQQGKVGPALDGLLTLAQATFFVAFQFEGLKPMLKQARSRSWRTTVEEAQRLRELGLVWLDVLVALKRVTAEERRRILAGQGHEDTMGDLIALARLLRPNWALLAPLQELHAQPEQRLTERTPDELEAAAAALGEGLITSGQSADEIDWHAQLIALSQLLRRDYDIVRAAITYYHADLGQPEPALTFPSFDSFRRPPTRSKPAAPPAAADSTTVPPEG